jgi:AAA family ATP:ADP antiporter
VLKLAWPIEKGEYGKFFTMAALIFAILFNYSVIHTLKDSLIIPNMGAEAANFVEIWVILPAVFVFMLLYLKLSALIHDPGRVFYLICSFFLIFFILFGFVIYPQVESLHLKTLHDFLVHKHSSLKWFALMCYDWPYVLFNVFSELWVNTMLALLFWQYANNVTTTEQAKRFYPLLIFIGNLSLIGSGQAIKKISLGQGDLVIQNLMVLVTIVGIICMLIFKYLLSITKVEHEYALTSHKKISFIESIKLVASSHYLWLLAIALIAYGLTINISQSLWKSQVIKLYPTTHEYLYFSAQWQQWVGVISSSFMLIGGVMVQRFSWLTLMIIPALTMLVGGVTFLFAVMFENPLLNIMSLHSYMAFVVFFGAAHIVFAKSTKFSLFDPCKEIAYIPLEKNLRDKGKAAVDMLGERFGKSSGALLQTILFLIFPSLSYEKMVPAFILVFLLTVVIWLFSIKILNQKYLKSLDEREIHSNIQ